uniref:Uncharacterized protein n=1 Tax=Parascaris equorum TaxID=6256 RepID=A0A914S5B9_PAREQ
MFFYLATEFSTNTVANITDEFFVLHSTRLFSEVQSYILKMNQHCTPFHVTFNGPASPCSRLIFLNDGVKPLQPSHTPFDNNPLSFVYLLGLINVTKEHCPIQKRCNIVQRLQLCGIVDLL